MSKLAATATFAGLVGCAASAEPASNGLHLNGLHLNGLQLNGLRMNDQYFNGHWSDQPADFAPTFNAAGHEAEEKRVTDSLRALAAAPLTDE